MAIQDQQLGTGHAVLCGLSALPDDFGGVVVVTSGDIPLLDADTLADLVATHSARDAAVTVLTTTLSDPTGYGRILRTQDHEVIAIVEQADATPLAAGDPRGQRRRVRLRHRRAAIGAEPAVAPTTHSRSCTSPTSSRSSGRTGRRCRPGTSTTARWWPGVNNRVQLAELAAELNRRIVAGHQLAGVTVVDPATTWIDVDVTIGRDTVVHPGTQLLGGTRDRRSAAASARTPR